MRGEQGERRVELEGNERKSWEIEGRKSVPKEVKSSFFTNIGGEGFFINVISLGSSFAVKIALKSPTRRSFVRLPADGVGIFLDRLTTIVKENVLGRVKEVYGGRFTMGLYDEREGQVCRIVEHIETLLWAQSPYPNQRNNILGGTGNWMVWELLKEDWRHMEELKRKGRQQLDQRSNLVDNNPTSTKSYAKVIEGG